MMLERRHPYIQQSRQERVAEDFTKIGRDTLATLEKEFKN